MTIEEVSTSAFTSGKGCDAAHQKFPPPHRPKNHHRNLQNVSNLIRSAHSGLRSS